MAAAYDLSYTVDEIIVTSGVQEALMVSFLALLGPDDEILCPAPAYSVYKNQADLIGAKIVDVFTGPEDEWVHALLCSICDVRASLRSDTILRDSFVMMPAAIEAALTPKSKVLVHMSPNNPTVRAHSHTPSLCCWHTRLACLYQLRRTILLWLFEGCGHSARSREADRCAGGQARPGCAERRNLR